MGRSPASALEHDVHAAVADLASRPDPRVSRLGRLLRLRYVDALEVGQVQRDLGTSKSEYFREQARAVEMLAALLWDRWRLGEPGAAESRVSAGGTSEAADTPFVRADPIPAERHNLPAPLNSFVGRESEVAEIRRLLAMSRLVTLLGPPGVGKTRLAQEVARSLVDDYADGVRFVSLAPIADPSLVVSAIAQVVGVQDRGVLSVRETLRAYLRDREMLLVLDNFEQVTAGASVLGELLAACPRLRALVTSREVLHLYGERDFRVPPLSLPELPDQALPDGLLESAAVRLFVDRAEAASAGFVLTPANSTTVAEICRRLDGLPLAIELAAVRVRLLPLEVILSRLGSRLALLTDGSRDLPTRQRTLRAALAWSHDLLSAEERTLFRRLGVFVGGFSLDAVGAVCGEGVDAKVDPLDLVGSLLDKSLIWQQALADGEPRFGMLETIREYALDQLAASGEMELVRRSHAGYFLALAEEGNTKIYGSGSRSWLDTVEREHDNLRAALRWAEEAGEHVLSLRIAAPLHYLWWYRGYLAEGRGWLEPLIRRARDLVATPRDQLYLASALISAGTLARMQDDLTQARAYSEEALEIRRRHGDDWSIGHALDYLGMVIVECEGPLAEARQVFEAELAIWRKLGDRRGLAWALRNLGAVSYAEGDLARARELVEEGLAAAREIDSPRNVAIACMHLGRVLHRQGDQVGAQACLREAGENLEKLGEVWLVPRLLEVAAGVLVELGQHEDAARLLGASSAIGERAGNRPYYTRLARLAGASAPLEPGREAFSAVWDEGRRMTASQAVAFVISRCPTG